MKPGAGSLKRSTELIDLKPDHPTKTKRKKKRKNGERAHNIGNERGEITKTPQKVTCKHNFISPGPGGWKVHSDGTGTFDV